MRERLLDTHVPEDLRDQRPGVEISFPEYHRQRKLVARKGDNWRQLRKEYLMTACSISCRLVVALLAFGWGSNVSMAQPDEPPLVANSNQTSAGQRANGR